ncbi:ApeA N-terminal domain 1-containing protein [Bifidobacterium myosotis]|uniref:ApeA N-terminal domain-containing protein n=1 Tax=Bifidobacterium myosotis TaxID=1630166 RepID=A0A5M9ZK66_9BIFI|nr:HEPN domain-containing protein [Bifidobacterium myosotis]KAA8828007.1 hypothetical protein EMO91_06030 [Bifidobacterium myosotis]
MSDKWQLTEPLIGYIILGNGPDSEIPAVLRDTGKRIELTVPFKDIRAIPGNWFVASRESVNGVLYFGNQIPDTMPHDFLFACNGDSFALAGCRVSGNTRSMGLGIGTGTAVPTYVVCGARNSRYAEINGLRTQWLDAVRWFNLPSMTYHVEQDEEGKCQGVEVCSKSIPPVLVDEKLGLSIRPNFNVTQLTKNDSVISHQLVYIETKTDVAKSWEEHLATHRAIKDLISIADWNSREFIDMSAMSTDDSENIGGKGAVRDRWSPVVSYYPLVKRDNNENFQNTFLFDYRDIGNAGILKWLDLRKDCEQGMTSLSYLARDHSHLALETMSMLVGTTLECVGWYIVQSKHLEKWIKKSHGKEQPSSYQDMLKAIIEKNGIGDFFKNSLLWTKTMRDVYIGNKHADAHSSDFQTTYEATMQSLVVLRVWLGLQLGADIVNMKNRLASDAIGKHIPHLLA